MKRHLTIGKHVTLTAGQREFALKVARQLDKNKTFELSDTSVKVKSKLSKANYENTRLVNRKFNYKECILCDKLCMNISDHINGVHDIKRLNPLFQKYVCDSKVVPKVYTKLVDKKVVLLEGSELEQAQDIYGKKVYDQKHTLHGLTKLRKEMIEISDQIELSATDISIEKNLKEKLMSLDKEYKTLRYKDNRSYSPSMTLWKTKFEEHLHLREHFNPSRGSKMAMDVMLCYEKTMASPLTLKDLTNGVTLRDLLQSFRKSENLLSSTKCKYLKMFQMFITYLLCDCSSPERAPNENNEDFLLRGMRLQEINHEIDSVNAALLKRRGSELVKSKQKAAGTIMSEEELDEMKNRVRKYLLTVLEDDQETLDKYCKTKVLEIRDHLMAIATLRLGRRSMEIINMRLSEVENADLVTTEDGDRYYIVKVLEQKNLKAGEAAPVAFSADEFNVLNIYIKCLRAKLTNSENTAVFPATGLTKALSTEMSFSAACRILQKFVSSTGKKLTSRVARRSIITNSRKLNLSDHQRREYAKSMSHTPETADRYYNFTDLSNSVTQCLSIQKKHSETTVSQESSNNSIAEAPCSTSTPIKVDNISARKRKFSEVNEGLDATLKNLRNKKIKSVPSMTIESSEIEKKIREFIRNLEETGEINSLTTSKGLLCVQPITRALPKGMLKLFSVREIRKITKKILEAA
jgi:hypothetical protein